MTNPIDDIELQVNRTLWPRVYVAKRRGEAHHSIAVIEQASRPEREFYASSIPPNGPVWTLLGIGSEPRSRGVGSILLDRIVEDADREAAWLILEVTPAILPDIVAGYFTRLGISTTPVEECDDVIDKLVNFYRKVGFAELVHEDSSGHMYRAPAKTKRV